MSKDSAQKKQKVIKPYHLIPGIISLLPRTRTLKRIFKIMLEIRPGDYLSLAKMIEENAIKYKDKNAILYEDRVITWDEMNQEMNKIANYLLSLGFKKGDEIPVMMENRPEILFVLGAAAKTGVIASLINTNQREAALLHSLNLTANQGFIVGEELLGSFEEVRDRVKMADSAKLFYVKDKTGAPAPEGYLDLEEATASASVSNPSTTQTIQLKDPLCLIFTSGTTGMPKAAIITNFQQYSATQWMGGAIMNLDSDDVIYITLPFIHSNAIKVGWSASLWGGAAVAIRRKFSASNFWTDARKYNATAFNYIGELCRYLMNQPPQPDDAKNPITKMVGNGLRPELWKGFKKRFNIKKVYEFYGATEMLLSFYNLFNLDETMGVCLDPYAIVKYDLDADEPVRDENGRLIKVGRGEAGLLIGQIIERLPFDGYTDESASAKKIFKNAFEDGDMWLNTGDMVRDIGCKHGQFVDRLGDTFRWKGENVSTTEVEEIVNTSNLVEGSSVYGVQIPGTDGRAGMAALLTSKPHTEFDLATFLAHVKTSLPHYAVPIFLRFKERFDTTDTMKIKKTDLKKEGFDPALTQGEAVYVLLPKATEYVPLTAGLYQEIIEGKHPF